MFQFLLEADHWHEVKTLYDCILYGGISQGDDVWRYALSAFCLVRAYVLIAALPNWDVEESSTPTQPAQYIQVRYYVVILI